jgi:hypothetical protein
MKIRKLATPLGKYRGKKYYRFTVYFEQSGIGWNISRPMAIIASSAIEACNAIRNEFAHTLEYPAEFICCGPAGGRVDRFVGWESMIWAKMVSTIRGQEQIPLPL